MITFMYESRQHGRAGGSRRWQMTWCGDGGFGHCLCFRVMKEHAEQLTEKVGQQVLGT